MRLVREFPHARIQIPTESPVNSRIPVGLLRVRPFGFAAAVAGAASWLTVELGQGTVSGEFGAPTRTIGEDFIEGCPLQ